AGTGDYYTRQAGEIGRSLKVAVLLKLRNAKADGLGLPLPAGVVRVYQRDSAGGTQFVGEDRIDHTPENESAELTLGQAFDVTARKTQTDFRVLSTGKDERRQYESAYRIEIKNAKKAAVTVTVLEPIAGDWRMIDSSLAHEKVAAHTARWRVTVPAGGSQTLTYRVRVHL
ncbi:MAG TPA: DUF4139 domain-containing protein, partial [Gammaproteobacteria bacterium]|nr:DUF4139 domain-containing protein [Gammaproteobacteria bacterium]